MKNIYLKIPEINDKDKWLDYIKEYKLDDPNANPLGYTEDTDYEEWLKKNK